MSSTSAAVSPPDIRPAGPAGSSHGDEGPVHVDVFTSLADAMPDWRRLTDAGAVTSLFGQAAWIAAWQRHVGEPAGVTPSVVVGRDGGATPMFVLPLCVRRLHGARIAEFFGDSHSSVNFGVWRPDAIERMSAERVHDVLARASAAADIDLFILRYLPGVWEGRANPLLLLPHQRGSDDIYRIDIDGRSGENVIKACLSGSTRGTFRSKERKLSALDGYRYFRAATLAEVDHVLDAFFAQKAARLTEHGIANVFGEPGVETFLRETCHIGLAEGRPMMELHAIEGDGEVLAMMGGLTNGRRFSTMVNSYTLSEHGRWSPGLIVISQALRHFADQGYEVFDLGMGFAPYKQYFCKSSDELFDCFVPITARGHLAAIVARNMLAAKRWIKSTPAVWSAVQRLRKIAA